MEEETPKVFDDIKPDHPEVKQEEKLKTLFSCNLCPKSYGKKEYLKRHVTQFHEKVKPFKCLICNQSFFGQANADQHLRAVHERQKPFGCSKCGKSFADNRDLQRHVEQVHDKVRKATCSICEKTFYDGKSLNTHTKNVHGAAEKKFKCQLCSSAFTMKCHLDVHFERTHEKVKKYACDLCDKRY